MECRYGGRATGHRDNHVGGRFILLHLAAEWGHPTRTPARGLRPGHAHPVPLELHRQRPAAGAVGAAETKEPYRALVAGRVARSDGYADSPLLVERLREVGVGITEEITVRNYSLDPVECVVSLSVEADFADLFEVKEARILRDWDEPGSRTQVR